MKRPTKNDARQFDLFLDESGRFMETSTDPAERIEDHRNRQTFPSQLVGVLAPRGHLTVELARSILERGCESARGTFGSGHVPTQWNYQVADFHANKLHQPEPFGRLTESVAEALNEQRIQPVRLVNKERAAYGDRVAVYTNLVAELLVRIFREQAKEGAGETIVHLTAARVTLGKDKSGTEIYIEPEEYKATVQEYLQRFTVWRGYGDRLSKWKLGSFRFGAARDDPRIHLADLLSNASHADYKKCDASAEQTLRRSFARYDQSLFVRELLERVEEHVQNGALGLALLLIADRLVQTDGGAAIRSEAMTCLDAILDELVILPLDPRNAQLAIVSNWVAQMAELRQQLQLSYQLCQWLQTNVAVPLQDRLTQLGDSASITWFIASLHIWSLTACNHRGAVREGRQEADAFERLIPHLAGQWEYASLLMEGLVRCAVHQNDCFEHQRASVRMALVADYYGQLSRLFIEAMPDVFPDRVRSDLRGKALGTRLQSEIYLGLVDPAHLTTARSLSDEAIDEFPSVLDQERQWQYRCELETHARDFSGARAFLARSLRLEDDSHTAIARKISDLGRDQLFAQGFALLHWFRLGAVAWLNNDQQETNTFQSALGETRLLASAWCQGDIADYPAHGILRRATCIHALKDDRDGALGSLAPLRRLCQAQGESFTLTAILTASTAELAGLLWRGHERHARLLLDNRDKERPGLLQILDDFERRCNDAHLPSLWAPFSKWRNTVSDVLSGTADEYILLRYAMRVGY